ncbi:ceramide synthase 4-like [Clavelina lepadiformis]|uniref:ceramide synthase 4-like n=1 Tax=Clavelina lepadiformis TaxID=159417 RepID=UPI004042146A
MEAFSNWLWKDEFWLPPGVSFKDLQDKPGFYYAKPRDLPMMVVYAIGLFVLRLLFERVVTKPLAKKLNIRDKTKKPVENECLEKVYKDKRSPSEDHMRSLAKALNWSNKKVDNWFRRRRNQDRPKLTKKLAEASWRCFFYLVSFTFGMSFLVQAPWFWDNLKCWTDYPRQTLWPSVYYYYMLEGGFYISLLFSIMRDNRRKDFVEQLIHHTATIFLILFSYVANFVRVGSLVMAIHDISDIILECAKCFVYAKMQVLADNLFTLFAIVFIVSRIIIYPYVVIHTTWVKSMWLFRPYPGYYFFNALLMVLQLLHIFWSAIIIKMAVKMAVVGKLEKDDRSDVEEETSDDEENDTDNHVLKKME